MAEEDILLIRCPECRQRFKVRQELRERMVECGVCNHRFHIREDVIARSRKFYPGERRDKGLRRFHRVAPPDAGEGTTAPPSRAAQHAPPAYHTPAPPQRVIAGFIGVVAMLFVSLLMIFGTSHGGVLDGMGLTRKLVMCGFTGLLGFLLLLYANPHTRILAAIFGGSLAAALCSLPFLIAHPPSSMEDPPAGQARQADVPATMDNPDPEEMLANEMRERIGLRPLEQEIERIATSGEAYRAYGLVLVGLQESNRIAVRDYLFRVTSAAPRSHIYPRQDGKFLFVLTGLDMNLESLAALAEPLGSIRRILPDLHLAEILIDNEIFLESPNEKLINRDDPEFYRLNLRDLRSIDIQRIQRAVQRLAEAEPRMFRSDITDRLRELLDESGVQFHGPIARALTTWDTDRAAAARLANQSAIRLQKSGQVPAVELVTLALDAPDDGLIPVLVALWRDNILTWENHCIRLGPAIEQAMIREFESSDGSRSQSAARILSRVGGDASARKLRQARENANQELAVVINQALEQIASRAEGGE